MPNEVTPTQADRDAAQRIERAMGSFLLTGNSASLTEAWKAAAAPRMAHEAPLRARVAELEGELGVFKSVLGVSIALKQEKTK